MSSAHKSIVAALKWPSIVVMSIVIGCAAVDVSFLWLPILLGAAVLGSFAAYEYSKQASKRAAAAELQAQCEVLLMPSLKPILAEASTFQRVPAGVDLCGVPQDEVAVASLIAALDRSSAANEPGWDAVCESIVGTIAKTGDTRCLPALGRIRTSRGSRLQDAVDAAIAAIICKQTGDLGGYHHKVQG